MADVDSISVFATGSTISTGAASSRVAIPVDSSGTAPRYIKLTSTQACYCKLGNSSVTAVAGDLMVQPSDSQVVKVNGATHVAALQVTSGGVLQISPLDDM